MTEEEQRTIYNQIYESDLYAGDSDLTAFNFIDPDSGLSGDIMFKSRKGRIKGDGDVFLCEFDDGEEIRLQNTRFEFYFDEASNAPSQLKKKLREFKDKLEDER